MRLIHAGTKSAFDFDERKALAIAEELTPVLLDLPRNELIAALAMHIAGASWEAFEDEHPAFDALTAVTLGSVVEQIVGKCFKANRNPEPLDDEAEAEDDE